MDTWTLYYYYCHYLNFHFHWYCYCRYQKCLGDAEELKQEGTSYFKEQNWKQAIATYTCALGQLPKRVVYKKGASDGNTTAKASAEGEDEDGGSKVEYNVEKPEEQLAGEDEDRKEGAEQPLKLTGIYLELAKARSVLNANIGACHLKLVSPPSTFSPYCEQIKYLRKGSFRKSIKKPLQLVLKVPFTFVIIKIHRHSDI